MTMGATTIWERWDSVLPDGTVNATGMTSLNHYALGAVADWLHRVVGGLERIEPGYKRVRIAPQPGGDLTWVRTVHDTIRGRFEVSWKIEGGEVVVDVTIPHDVEADIVLPFQPQDAERCVGEGVHSWRYPVSAGYGATAAVTMDSPIRDLTKRDGAWEAVSDVLQRYFPGLPLDPYAPEAAAMSLNAVLQHVPGASPVLENELKNALAIATQ